MRESSRECPDRCAPCSACYVCGEPDAAYRAGGNVRWCMDCVDIDARGGDLAEAYPPCAFCGAADTPAGEMAEGTGPLGFFDGFRCADCAPCVCAGPGDGECRACALGSGPCVCETCAPVCPDCEGPMNPHGVTHETGAERGLWICDGGNTHASRKVVGPLPDADGVS